MIEEWRSVPGYEGLYDVSSLGRVYSHPRKGAKGGLRRTPSSRGYPHVILHKDGQPRTIKVHILVLLAFAGPRPAGLEIRHLDGNPLNPRLSNLAYGTHSENTLDSVRTGTHNNASKTRCIRGHDLVDLSNIYVSHGIGSRQCRACRRVTHHLRAAKAAS